ncbi:MAG: MBL fold metallo-hydrolase [Clostridia bacterium]|nr:MBL fold metallo-hydrolase [Clostridia bacterium]
MCGKKKKKAGRLLNLGIMFTICCLFLAVYAYSSTTSIYIGSEKVPFSAQSGYPFTDAQGRMQVPLRAAMDAYGCKTTWSEAEKTVTLTKGDATVKVPIGKTYILINGAQKTTDTAALVKDGRTYLPIRPVLEAFGATVRWDEKKNAVMITQNANGELTVHFIDVGQGDSILIDNQDFEVLIDGGNNKDGQNVVAYLKDYVDGPLDLMIGTHPDADHIGGLDDVMEAYAVSEIIDSGAAKETKTYQEYWQAVQDEPNCNLLYDEDMTLDLGNGATLKIIETGDNYKDANDNSVVAQLNYGEISVLLAGDMEQEAESASLSKFGKVTVLKAGHHGSKTSSSQSLLNILQSEYVIISAGKGNSYGHPHKAVLERYFNSGATVYGTFRSGTIMMMTNGSTLSFNTNDPVVLGDAGD